MTDITETREGKAARPSRSDTLFKPEVGGTPSPWGVARRSRKSMRNVGYTPGLAAFPIAVSSFSIPSTAFPPWALMWTLAVVLWAAFKILAWNQAAEDRPRGWRLAAYFLWPGMDARAFSSRTLRTPRPPISTPVWPALLSITAGLVLLGAAAHAQNPTLAAGWLAMTGLILSLHFGSFDLLAAAWNRAGFPVRPLMDAPWRSSNLAEFWGRRWNRGFSDVARFALFQPLARRLGPAAGTMAGFAFSGLLHEIVLSLPARGGFGGPLLYFLIQGSAVCLLHRRGSCLSPALNRVIAGVIVLAPAFLLFHPPFLERVLLPFLHVLTTRGVS